MLSIRHKMRIALAMLAFAAISNTAFAFEGGTVIERPIQSQSLKQNRIGTDVVRKVTIYLPPNYNGSRERYPVVYMLGSDRAGFDQRHAANVFDRAISQRTLPPCIFVAVDLSTPLGPSWYTNSSVTGNWDDFASKEMISYVDSNFRTLPQEFLPRRYWQLHRSLRCTSSCHTAP